jgi:vitamin B12 transporter
MLKISIFITFLLSISFAEMEEESLGDCNELDFLLDTFEDEGELSQETVLRERDRQTNQIKVFTRQDIERSHYKTLKDILSTYRFLPYRESRFGEPDLSRQDPLPYGKSGQLIKIFIDNHEISAPYFESGITLFGDINLDFVDHIELYDGPASFEFVRDASILTIRIYSKIPERDGGERFGISGDSYGSFNQFFHTADSEGNLKYFLYLSNQKRERREIEDLSRDFRTRHFLGNFIYGNYNYTLQYLDIKRDGFLTNSLDGTPTKDDLQNRMFMAGVNRTFFDESLYFSLNYGQYSYKVDFRDDNLFLLFPQESISLGREELNSFGFGDFPLEEQSATLSFYPSVYEERYDIRQEVATLNLYKKWLLENHTVILGGMFERKSVDMRDSRLVYQMDYLSLNGTPVEAKLPRRDIDLNGHFKGENLYSLSLQERYHFTDRHSLLGGVKIDHEDNSYFRDRTNVNRQFGFTYKNRPFSVMTFYSYMHSDKIPYLFDKTDNRDIDNEKLTIVANELKYETEDIEFSHLFSYLVIEKLILFDEFSRAYNTEKDYSDILNTFVLKRVFDKDNYLSLELWRRDMRMKIDDLEFNGVDARLRFNHYYNGLTIKSVNRSSCNYHFLNEFAYVESDKEARYKGGSWIYNFGITYEHEEDLKIFLKGENLFDSMKGERFLNYHQGEKYDIPPVERRFIAGVEYSF